MTAPTAGPEQDGEALAPLYQRALELEAEGLAPGDLAACLDLEPEAVPVVLELAHRKARRAGD